MGLRGCGTASEQLKPQVATHFLNARLQSFQVVNHTQKNSCPLFNSVLLPGRFGYLDTLHFFNKVILIQLKIAYIRS